MTYYIHYYSLTGEFFAISRNWLTLSSQQDPKSESTKNIENKKIYSQYM